MNNPYVNFNPDNIVSENAEIFANSQNLGLLQGGVSIDENVTKYKLETGNPKSLQAEFLQELQASIKATLLEFTPDSMCFGLGISEALKEVWDGVDDEYDRFYKAAAEDQQVLQFKQGRNIGCERIRFAHKGVVNSGGEEPVLRLCPMKGVTPSPPVPWTAQRNVFLGQMVEPVTPGDYYYLCTTAGITGSVEPTWGTTPDGTTSDGTAVWTCKAYVPLVADTDYALSATNGQAYALPTSTLITSKCYILAKWKAIPPACDMIPISQTGFLAWEGDVLTTMTDIKAGRVKSYYMPRARIKSDGIKTAGAAPWTIGITIDALDDTANTPDDPLGYWYEDVEVPA